MTEMEKMMKGLDFDGFDPEIVSARENAARLKLEINQCIDDEERLKLQSKLFGRIGYSLVQPPFHCEFGKTISIGESTFINMNVVMLDNAAITIGNNVLIKDYTPSENSLFTLTMTTNSSTCYGCNCSPIHAVITELEQKE